LFRPNFLAQPLEILNIFFDVANSGRMREYTVRAREKSSHPDVGGFII
jgi:hypothetical protein